MKLKRVVRALAFVLGLAAPSLGFGIGERCNAELITIQDICWDCILPIKIEGPCVCPDPTKIPCCFTRYGFTLTFWEPVWLFEAVRKPLCLLQIGAKGPAASKYPPGYIDVNGGSGKRSGNHREQAFYQAHLYENFWWAESLGSEVENACRLELSGGGNYNVTWISEFDPTWDDDVLAMILGPEVALFANIPAQAACAADCVAATATFPIDLLFWCAGCQGSLYPMGGNTESQTGGIMASTLLAERMIAKMHRVGQAWDTTSWMCASSPLAPIVKKSQYRVQVSRPRNVITGASSSGWLRCPAFGGTDLFSSLGREIPYTGEDFGYVIWRQRRCCVSN